MALEETSGGLSKASDAARVYAELQLGRLLRRESRYSWRDDCGLIVRGPSVELAVPVGLDEHAIEVFLETADESMDIGFHLRGITALTLLLRCRWEGRKCGG